MTEVLFKSWAIFRSQFDPGAQLADSRRAGEINSFKLEVKCSSIAVWCLSVFPLIWHGEFSGNVTPLIERCKTKTRTGQFEMSSEISLQRGHAA